MLGIGIPFTKVVVAAAATSLAAMIAPSHSAPSLSVQHAPPAVQAPSVHVQHTQHRVQHHAVTHYSAPIVHHTAKKHVVIVHRSARKHAKRHAWEGPWRVYDSAQPNEIPSNAPAVAGYVTGAYAWTQSEWDAFPHAAKISIDIVGGDTHAQVEDVETGGVPVGVLRAWAQARLRMGQEPVVYCAGGMAGPVASELHGISWRWWAAQPNGFAHVAQGSVTTQYLWTSGYDVSLTNVDPAHISTR